MKHCKVIPNTAKGWFLDEINYWQHHHCWIFKFALFWVGFEEKETLRGKERGVTDWPTSRLQRRPSERSREHFLFVGLRHHFGTLPGYKLRRHFSSSFLLALGLLVETGEIDLNFSIDFRPLDEWCELWRSDGFSPFIKSIPCCLDDCCMSLGWLLYVSWMVTVCLTQHMVGPQWAMLGWTSCLSTKWHSYLLLNVGTNINNWTSDYAWVREYNSLVWLFHQATNTI